MFGSVSEKQRKTILGKLTTSRDLSWESNKDFAGGRKTLAVCEQRPGINHVDAKAHFSGEFGHWHRNLPCPKDIEIRAVANNVDEDLDSSMLIRLDRLKSTVELQGARDTFRQQLLCRA